MGKLGAAIAFLAGAAVGGAAAWYFIRERYSSLAEEEIRSVKETFAKREEQRKKEAEQRTEVPRTAVAAKAPEKGDISDYTRRVQDGAGFTQYSKTVVPKPEYHAGMPYVISPEEFGEMDDYTQISLTYFDDGILSDENGIIIDDPEEMVGDALDHFGEYEEDSVFVRSDIKRCDYEILRDLRSYAEFRTTLPPRI